MALPCPAPDERDAASSTSLKWGSDGELSAVDLQRILERLSDCSLTQCELDPPEPSGGRV